MKLISVTASLSRDAGGVFYAVSNLAKAQLNDGINVQVVGLNGQKLSADKSQWGKVPLQTFRTNGPFSFGYAPGMKEYLLSENPTIIHSHGIWMYPSIAVSDWQCKTNRPLIIAPHGMLDPWALKHSGWKKKIALWLYEGKNLTKCSCFHALCLSEYRSIRALGYRQPIAVVPNGVDLPILNTQKTKKKNGDILYLGRLHEKKNLVTLLQAWNNLSNNIRKNRRLRIFGWGESFYKDQLKRNLGPFATLEDPAYGSKKDQVFREASAFILPSLSEGLPMSVLEAWSYGLPVLMSQECNLPEGFKVGAALETGTGKDKISRALEHFLKIRESERLKMGHKGRKLVEDQFTWPLVASKMIKVYQWLEGKGPKPKWVFD